MAKLTKEQYEECKKQFLELGEMAFEMSHYRLAMETYIPDAQVWKAFLMDPRTVDFVNSEMSIIRNAAINEIVKQSPNSKSVGQAQLVNSLMKLSEQATTKDGPTFIYCYVPLNDEQIHAPNVEITDERGELKNVENWSQEPTKFEDISGI